MAKNYAKYRKIIADIDLSESEADQFIGELFCLVESLLDKKYRLAHEHQERIQHRN
jgi:hypothetical protein